MFSEVVCRDEMVEVKRFCNAPKLARMLLTEDKAPSITSIALCAPAAVLTSIVEIADSELALAEEAEPVNKPPAEAAILDCTLKDDSLDENVTLPPITVESPVVLLPFLRVTESPEVPVTRKFCSTDPVEAECVKFSMPML